MRRTKKPVFFIVLLCILGLGYLTFFGIHTYFGDTRTTYIKGADEIRWGIDIQGGVNATFEPADGYEADSDEMDSAKAIIEQRLVALNITDSEVYVDYSKGRVIVSFPWQAGEESFDPEQAVKELGETAVLRFIKGTEFTDKDDDANLVLTGKDVEKASAGQYQDKDTNKITYVVELKLKDSGTEKFREATSELYPSQGQISIWMDESMISAPRVQAVISDGSAQISGDFTYDSAKSLADKINAGSLPFKLETTSTNIISATLGSGARDAMLIAGIIAFICVAIYMIIIYRLPGFVASIALVGQVIGSVACISGFFPNIESFTLTIPGIAGIILAVGMGVDANVITAERIKEELLAGKTLTGAITTGYKRAWSAVFDGNITVVFVAVILMGAFGPTDSAFGTLLKPIFSMFGAATAGTIYCLGYTLLVGIILNFVFGVFCSRLMLSSLSKFKAFRSRKWYGVPEDEEKRSAVIEKRRKVLRPNSHRKVFYAVSCTLIAVFAAVTIISGLDVAIEFKGGTIITYTYEGTVPTGDVEKLVTDTISETAAVTEGEDFSSGKQTLKLSFSSDNGISQDKQSQLADALKQKFPDSKIEVLESTDVAASNGTEFFFKCLVACAFAAVITVIYIGFRFRKIGGLSAGGFAVLALIHDMCMVYGCFVLCRFAINANFMAVLLTILGYSINATIIVYDRIRENERLYGRKYDTEELVNMSITQTLGRSIHTTVTTVLAMTVVCIVCAIWGITSIMSFAFPLIIGMIAGVYSSNCIAPTLWVLWQKHAEKKRIKNGGRPGMKKPANRGPKPPRPNNGAVV
ncbi:SecD/SecF fusion protein [Ruminococcaceae bacterium FB2012]|nr:SecD/SecF fusion protein [Ruminococcaceae bacterium FB2012]